ncbi:MAG TPA: DUF3021 family protein [Lachnospiraceae bacterium]|nr:DUF3021 family protein [Lachnospiraceae bacterium]
MKNFKNEMLNRIPWITLTFFISILSGAIGNIVQHNDPSGFCLFAVELAGCCIGLYVVTYLVELIPFRHYIAFHITNALSCYVFFMGCAYFFHFFGFRLSNIFVVTIQFIIFYIILTALIIYDYRKKSKQINDLIQKKQQ